MQNSDKEILNILMSDRVIAEKFGKLISGQYLTDRERKDGAKAIIDRWSDLAKIRAFSELEKKSIEMRALSLKTWIESIREVNF